MEHIIHSIEPVFDAESRVLILGTMPSPKSREVQFYYGHPQNHFWRIMEAIWPPSQRQMVTDSYENRIAWLLDHGLGLWDVYASCHREGSLDQAIEDAEWNDFAALREQWSAQWSNTAALAVATVANTWANRRWTFGVTGAKGAATHQLQGFLVFALTWALTSGGLHLLAAEWPGAPRWVEVAAVAVATFTSTAVKYVLMRYWMFSRIVSNPRRGSHRPH